MILYFSSFTIDALENYLKIFPGEKLNILISYGLRNGNFIELIDNADIKSLIVDSGTYTLANAKSKSIKKKISFIGYLTFLKYLKYDFAFAYDKYFDKGEWQFNVKLFDQARDRGFELVPVVHSYRREEINAYLDRKCKIIALGASEKKTSKYISESAKFVNAQGARIHLLGSTKFELLAPNPIHYGDSSSWVQFSYRGNVKYFSKKFQENRIFTFQDHLDSKKNRQEDIEDFNNYIKDETKEKLSYRWLLGKNSIYRQVMNIRYFINLERRITQYRKDNNII